ncbi:hypothetical protein DEO72_LG9g2913 [Vigna unguiculata]|uniref:Myb-like domain-containing protein n=1 Tax=Vigna unguiculata TaxID=3917 RepID=A0A4D6N4S1_VIGUN|nr:hypothetical protein DEO72_LG9g2913 [Vigna unguiculata]
MSDPSTTPLPHPPLLPDPHRQPLHHHHHHPVPLIQGAASTAPPSSSSSLAREYRKGNWTIQETLILITAKKLDDERRLKTPHDPTRPACTSPSSSARTSGELRWKWVENYCWSHGCLRSQNQCNDKWDNLLRDYKKVRDYESKSQQQHQHQHSHEIKHFPSYWTLNKQQRKEQNLPSNMVYEVYHAITEVLQRKQPQPQSQSQTQIQRQPQLQPQPPVALITDSSPPPPPPPPVSSTPPAVSERSESSEGTEHSEDDADDGSESKRRKVKNLGSSIMRGASVLARALRSCEEKKEIRHRELIELEQRRLQMEEARTEVHRQGIATLVAAVTNLSGAIQSLINSERHGQR